MKPDPMSMQAALRKRVMELQKIIHQMKQDNLHTGTVYKNLRQELDEVKTQLADPQDLRDNPR